MNTSLSFLVELLMSLVSFVNVDQHQNKIQMKKMPISTGDWNLIHLCFAYRAVHEHSQKLAVVLDDQCLSYAESLHASNYLAMRLLEGGYVKNVGDIVCQCMSKSIEMVS